MCQFKFVVQSALVMALAGFCLACSQPDIFVQERQFFDQQVVNNPALKTRYLEQGGFKLKYVSSGASDAPTVVYLHGTPGGWDNGARYLMDDQLLERAFVVSLDRPGWGESQFADGGFEASFASQNKLLKPLFERLQRENNHRGIILVGHSLGASLAPYIAMQNPELITGLILLSGSLDPQLGSPRWYNWAASMGVVSWFLGEDMRRANDEIMQLRNQLDGMRDKWQYINIPVTVMHGSLDTLVYPANVDFAEQVLTNADMKVIRIAGANHFIPWENRDLVTKEIQLMLDKLGK